tara:strand:- start:16644 stop:17192 length:549 start_codon:yes stop_codon:yes gene_type:complete
MDLIKNISFSKLLPEIKIVEFDVFSDSRGLIWTSYLPKIEEKILPKGFFFKHDKFNISKKRVLRGIHGDNKTWKFVSCPLGNIEQVIVDLRKESKNFKKWVKFDLNEKNKIAILIPPGFGNAFCTLSDKALYHYKLAYKGEYNDFDNQFTFAWNDKSIGIKWKIKNPIVSERDKMEIKNAND